MVKRKKYKREKRGIRVTTYVLLMVIIICAYLSCQYIFAWSWLTETVATIIAIISAVAFWVEYHENKLLNEAQFIMELNEQFIGDENMSGVEWELERYFSKFRKGEITEDYCQNFEKKYSLDNRDRQHLVNYLVHLEGIAALVKNKVLHIETIDDLMSYRYFIAMNNPVVQKLELLEYPEFYKGCFEIYEAWVDVLERQGITPPMYDKERNNLVKKIIQ